MLSARRSKAIKKIDKLGTALVAVLSVLAAGAAYAALRFGWFHSPWEMALWLGIGLAFLLGGVGTQIHRTPKNTNVHGAARPASESEAQASARGDAKSPALHDRTFPD